MAVIDLTGEDRSPLPYAIASQGTTWQEIKIPSWAARVSIYADAACWVSWVCGISGVTEPADGNAASGTTHKFTHVGSAVLEVQHSDTLNVNPNVTQNRSIFIAAKSGTAAVEIVFEQAKG